MIIISLMLRTLFLTLLASINAATQNLQSAQQEILQSIGPTNLNERYIRVKQYQDSAKKSFVDAVSSYYNFRPMLRSLQLNGMSDRDLFETLVKRELSWTFPEKNEFGLMRCEEDLLFKYPHQATFIELEPNGRRAAIQRIDNSNDYSQAVDSAKRLQWNCLMKGLEKSTGSPNDCQTRIPLCFADNWQQIWWKDEGNQQQIFPKTHF